jgi:hypothetical protein
MLSKNDKTVHWDWWLKFEFSVTKNFYFHFKNFYELIIVVQGGYIVMFTRAYNVS